MALLWHYYGIIMDYHSIVMALLWIIMALIWHYYGITMALLQNWIFCRIF
jgi:F0F1-type ATP synthase membrane subunit a